MTIKEVKSEEVIEELPEALSLETRNAMQVEQNYNTIPEEAYEVEKIYNPNTKRFKKYYRCLYHDCKYVFD